MNWNVRNAFVPGCVMRLKGDLWIVDVTVDGERGSYIGVEGIYFYTSICILFSLCYFWFWLCHWKEGWINQAKTSLSLIFLGSSGCCYLLWIPFFKKYFYFFFICERLVSFIEDPACLNGVTDDRLSFPLTLLTLCYPPNDMSPWFHTVAMDTPSL